jgi:hypothetical protein
MPDQITPKDIQEAAGAFDRAEIRTLDDLRMCISKDVDNNIHWLSEVTKVKHSMLVALLIAEFDDDTALSGKRKLRHYWRGLTTLSSVLRLSRSEIVSQWSEQKSRALFAGPRLAWLVARQLMIRQHRLWYNWRRHWPDALVFVLLPVLLVSLALRAQSINDRNLRYVTVQRGAAVPAFQKLTDNLALTNVPYAKGAFNSIDEVRGRYTLVNLPSGATVSSDQLLSPEWSSKMADRRILSVPMQAGAYPLTMRAPCDAIMVLSPRTNDVKDLAMVSFGVIVLRFEKIGETTSATVAIQKEEFEQASMLLASRDVYLAQISR